MQLSGFVGVLAELIHARGHARVRVGEEHSMMVAEDYVWDNSIKVSRSPVISHAGMCV